LNKRKSTLPVTGFVTVQEGERLIRELLDLIKEQAQQIATKGWQPISTAPKDGTVIVAWGRGDGPGSQQWVEKVCYWEAPPGLQSCWTFDVDGCKCEPEGWMPLPSPPVADEGITT